MEQKWLQQDGDTPHTAGATLKWLQDHFGGRVISKKAQVTWPAHSPDLTPPDFFLWGYLKSKVYHPEVETLADLKNSIRKQIRLIKPDLCERVSQEVLKRADVCVSRKGSYVENVL